MQQLVATMTMADWKKQKEAAPVRSEALQLSVR
jgi:hypothetical protein